MKHAVKKIHFVGIGGAGMSGIAEILHNLGYAVSGSDQSDSADLAPAGRLGIRVHVGHDAANIAGAAGRRHVHRRQGRQPRGGRGARASASRWCRAR